MEQDRPSYKDRHWQSKNFVFFVVGIIVNPIIILLDVLKHK